MTVTTPISPSPSSDDQQSEARLGSQLIGFGICRVAPEEIPAFRKHPGPVPEGSNRLGPALLKNSDDQTVAGVIAVLRAIAAMGIDPSSLADWGVIAATRFLGRSTVARALQQFQEEGVWGMSPHLTSHCGLHSPSGTISLAFNIQGPNMGVGGGQYAETQAFLAAATWLASGKVPGVILVLSGWSPELRPGRAVESEGPSVCEAVALILVSDGNRDGPGFQVEMATVAEKPRPLDLETFIGNLESSKSGDAAIVKMSDAAGMVRVAWRMCDEVGT